MKELFPGHFKESDESLRDVWATSLFVFDANILLNLYRYSDTTRNELLRILDKMKDRVWIPHRAAEEYLSNRLAVIDQQEKSYDDSVKSIESLKRDLENARQHPFVSKGVMEKVGCIFDELCNELKSNKSVHTARISSDDIKDSIADIFENRVGLPYDQERMEQLIAEGEERYTQKIPPGFKDDLKAGNSEVFSEKCRKYGDLIVWTQVIDRATELDRGVVLVTDDKKEDWWERFKGKTVGPRPELVKEFKDRANQTFHMYQADRFLELARENLGEKISEEIVEEIREVRRRDKLALRRVREIESYQYRSAQKLILTEELDNVQSQMANFAKEIHLLEDKRRVLENENNSVKDIRNKMLHEGGDESVDDGHLTEHYYFVSKSYEEALARLGKSRMKYHRLKEQMSELEQDLSFSMKIIEQENLV